MTPSVRRLVSRLLHAWRPHRAEQELAREVDAHLVLLADAYQRRGMTPEEARLAARRAFGGVEQTKDRHRDARSFGWLDDVRRDILYAVRTLRRSPGFAFTAIATIAIAIGVNAAVFTLVNTVLFRGFPLVTENDRIVYLTGPRGQGDLSYPDFRDWQAQSTSFVGMGAVADLKTTLGVGGGLVEKGNVTRITTNAFTLLGQRPSVGRDFVEPDAGPGALPVAILSDGFWERRFARDPAVIGQPVRIGGVPTTVIGVMPSGFSFPQRVDLWVPLTPTRDEEPRDARGLWFAFGRLTQDATQARAAGELATIAKRLATAYPGTNIDAPPRVAAFDELFIGDNARQMYGALFGAVVFVLLIACANLAHLSLARATRRSTEIAIRLAIGAARSSIARFLVIESLVLSAVGAVAGWWIAVGCLRVYQRFSPPPEWFEGVLDYSMDYRVFGFLVATSAVAGLLCGLAPAVVLSRISPSSAMKDGGRQSAGRARGRALSASLIAAEMALAVVLVAGAGVLLRSVLNLYQANLGVSTENTLVALFNLPASRYPDADRQNAFFDQLTARLGSLPGVESVAIASHLPGGGLGPQQVYEVAGAPSTFTIVDERRPSVSAMPIGSGYFRTVGAALVAGRGFSERDGISGLPAVIVNERFAQEQWPDQDPLGQRLRLFSRGTPGDWLTVVGVAPNIVQNYLAPYRIVPVVYVPYRQAPGEGMWLLMRTSAPPAGLAPSLRREVQGLDPELPIWSGPYPLTQLLGRAYSERARYGVLLSVFAAIALLLASVGLYGVTAHAVTDRTHEIGIRMAIGGSVRDVLRLIVVQAMVPSLMGLAVGLAASRVFNRLLTSELVLVSPNDPAMLILASVVLLAVAALGCLLPARRATRVDPVTVLNGS